MRTVDARHMSTSMRYQIYAAVVAGVLALGGVFAITPIPLAAEVSMPQCIVPADLVRLALPLERTARHLASRKLTLIVALGSSSTAGVGASSPEAAYPSRLMEELARRFPTQPIMVPNRGVAGERAIDMLGRFDDSVAGKHPDLVLWQVGTNAVLRGYEHARSDSVIRDGIRRMKAIGAGSSLHSIFHLAVFGGIVTLRSPGIPASRLRGGSMPF